MGAINETLRLDLRQAEFSEGYAESFQDAYVATQIKVLREQNEWTQSDLARELGTTQTAISRIENVNYSSWNISTLKKLARAFRVRLKVSFETYGSLIGDVDSFSREHLQRVPREVDPELFDVEQAALVEQPDKAVATKAETPHHSLRGLAVGSLDFDRFRNIQSEAAQTLQEYISSIQAQGLTLKGLATGTLSSQTGNARTVAFAKKRRLPRKWEVIVRPKRKGSMRVRHNVRREQTTTAA
jgi:transcriptional regulator with XRE-family HTH domain